jgi:hypothetical protein
METNMTAEATMQAAMAEMRRSMPEPKAWDTPLFPRISSRYVVFFMI